MNTKDALKKAIDAGYKPKMHQEKNNGRIIIEIRVVAVYGLSFFFENGDVELHDLRRILLEADFWQYFAKGLFSKKCQMCNEYEGGHNYRHPFTRWNDNDTKWIGLWKDLVEYLAKRKTPDDFFASL